MKKFIFILFLPILFNVYAEDSRKALGLNKTPEILYKSSKTKYVKEQEDEVLPENVDLSKNFPVPGMQGMQSSCTAWASAYALKTFHEKVERNWGFSNKTMFSPAFVYNQINGGNDQGAYISDALDVIVKQGCASFSTMKYDQDDYSTQPSQEAIKEASKYKAKSYAKLNKDNINSLKEILNKKNGFVIGAYITQSFYDYKGGVYSKQTGGSMGGHAMVVVGYDDNKNAFKIMNSWSETWGDKGYCWVEYNTFKNMVFEAWVLEDNVEGKPDEISEAPQNITASNGVYTDRIRIAWDPVTNATSYIIFRCLTKKGNYKEIGRASKSYFFDNKVESKKKYYYSVKSVDTKGESDFSDVAEGFIIESTQIKPGIPQNLSGKSDKEASFLQWDKVENATGYYIYKWSYKKSDYIKIGDSTKPNFKDKKVAIGKTYTYVVSAYNDNGESEKTYMVKVKVAADISKEELLPPTNFTVSKGKFTDKIEIKWDKLSNATSYYLVKWGPNYKEWETVYSGVNNFYTDQDIKQGKTYYYTVCSLNKSKYSEYTEYVTGFTSVKKYSISAATINVSKGKHSDKIVVTWKNNKEYGYFVKKAKVLKSKVDDIANYKPEKFNQIGPIFDGNFIDYDVTDGYIYYYIVVPFSDFGVVEDEIKSIDYGFTEGTEKNKVDKTYYKYDNTNFITSKDSWNFGIFNEKFYKYIDEAFNELDAETKNLK